MARRPRRPGSAGSRPPRTPHSVEVSDFETDINRWRSRPRPAPEVALTQNGAVVDDEEPVGIGLGEHRRDVEGSSRVLEPDPGEVLLGMAELEDRTVSTGDRRCANELAHAAKPETVVRTVEPVRARHAERPSLVVHAIDFQGLRGRVPAVRIVEAAELIRGRWIAGRTRVVGPDLPDPPLIVEAVPLRAPESRVLRRCWA